MQFSRRRAVKLNALSQLKQVLRFSAEAHTKNIKDIHPFVLEQQHKAISRRRFVGDMFKAGAVVGAAGLYQACATGNKKTQPVVAIIGAGIAGLHAGYILKQAGINANIYESSGRIGGRVFSVTDFMAKGFWTEMGGEFIDTDHTEMLALVKHFNLPLLDRKAPSEQSLKEYSYYFNKTHYRLKDILDVLHPVSGQIIRDINSLSKDIRYNSHSPADAALDSLTVMQYVEKLGISGWFKSFIYNGYTAEYGMDAGEQSALNFLTLIAPDEKGEFTPYGSSDERYSVIGGNEKICTALAAQQDGRIFTEHKLTSLGQNSLGRYKLGFNTGVNKHEEVIADIVMLTLPFTLLREVDITVPLPGWKLNTIKNLGYGSNSKIFVGMNERVWRKAGYAGYTFTDNGLMNGYDSTQMQNGNAGFGVFTIAPGGKPGTDAGKDYNAMKEQSVTQLDEIYPGAKASFTGRVQCWNWPGYAFAKGSYMSYKAGQYTAMQGAQFKPVGNLYFAGEHCSIASQGFMNGAAETGRMAAQMILKQLNTGK
ncbi:MAG TPA: FAD-dependent oxidoreductase [Chitinophagaceae bacterium]|nr:FAD-dependent oxidoreductase [Chitinophagaceae bacterium]